MKKVVYSIKKVRGNSDDKISGLGFLNEEGTLLCKCVSKNGKRIAGSRTSYELFCNFIEIYNVTVRTPTCAPA